MKLELIHSESYTIQWRREAGTEPGLDDGGARPHLQLKIHHVKEKQEISYAKIPNLYYVQHSAYFSMRHKSSRMINKPK